MSPVTLSPPPLHFLVTSFSYACGVHLCTFVCTTDTACHLYAHVSYDRPIIRRIPYQKRGSDFEMSSVTCFVELDLIEQNEAGDTTTHTFDIPFAEYDHTYYWYLTGTQGGVPCKSISQIFWHSCSPIYTQWIRCYPKPYWCSFYRISTTWADCVSGVGNGGGLTLSSTQTGWSWYSQPFLRRSCLSFDISSLPGGKTIRKAKLYGYMYSWKWANGGQSWFPNHQILLTFPDFVYPGTTAMYQQARDLTTEFWRKYYPNSGQGHYQYIDIPEALATVFTGKSNFCIAEKCGSDHDGIPVPWQYKTFGCEVYKVSYDIWLDVEVDV